MGHTPTLDRSRWKVLNDNDLTQQRQSTLLCRLCRTERKTQTAALLAHRLLDQLAQLAQLFAELPDLLAKLAFFRPLAIGRPVV